MDEQPPAAGSSVNVASESDLTLCPKCKGKLTDPTGLGWCPKCGYCRSVEAEAGRVVEAIPGPQAARKPSFMGMREFLELILHAPAWVKILTAGVVIIVAISYAAGKYLPVGSEEQGSLARALWGTIQLALGLLAIFLAQLGGMALLAPEDDKLGPKDLFMPFHLWGLAVKRLPRTRKVVWVGGWGATMGICAVYFVGGLDYWMELYKPKRRARPEMASAARELGKDGEGDLVKSVEDAANTQDLTKDKAKEKEKDKKKRSTMDCLILGYLPGEKPGTLEGVILATFRDDTFKPAGIVRKGFNQAQTEELLRSMKKLVRRQGPPPEFRRYAQTIKSATWIEPRLFCAVYIDGVDRDGGILNPSFKELLAAN